RRREVALLLGVLAFLERRRGSLTVFDRTSRLRPGDRQQHQKEWEEDRATGTVHGTDNLGTHHSTDAIAHQQTVFMAASPALAAGPVAAVSPSSCSLAPPAG